MNFMMILVDTYSREVKDKTLMRYIIKMSREEMCLCWCLYSVLGAQFYLWVFRFHILQKHDRCHCGCFKHLKSGQKRHLSTNSPPLGYGRAKNVRVLHFRSCLMPKRDKNFLLVQIYISLHYNNSWTISWKIKKLQRISTPFLWIWFFNF